MHLRCHGGVIAGLRSHLGRLLRLVGLRRYRHVGHVLRGDRDHGLQRDPLLAGRRLRRRRLGGVFGLVWGLPLLLSPLELLQALHDRAVRQALLVLDRGHAALLQVLNLSPHPAGLLLVLSRAEGQLVAAPVVRRVAGGLVRILLRGLHYRGAWRNQIQIASLQLLLEGLDDLAFALGEVSILRLLSRCRILVRLLRVVPPTVVLGTRRVRCALRRLL